jgi:hypothetical protein
MRTFESVRMQRMAGGLLFGVLLVSACGDDSDEAGSGESDPFCDEATALQVAMLGDGLTEDDAATAEQHATELREIEPPEEIADDWGVAIPALADFLEASSSAHAHLEGVENLDVALGAEGVEELDADDPEAIEAVSQMFEAFAAIQDEDVVASGDRVESYLAERCGDV